MRAETYLKRIEKLDALIENKQTEARRWREVANNTTVNMSGERVQSSGSHDTIANAICTYLDLEREEIDSYIAGRKEIIRTIEQLPPIQYKVLFDMYVNYEHFKTLKDIAVKYDCSYSKARGIHERALKRVQRILDERERHENEQMQ